MIQSDYGKTKKNVTIVLIKWQIKLAIVRVSCEKGRSWAHSPSSRTLFSMEAPHAVYSTLALLFTVSRVIFFAESSRWHRV